MKTISILPVGILVALLAAGFSSHAHAATITVTCPGVFANPSGAFSANCTATNAANARSGSLKVTIGVEANVANVAVSPTGTVVVRGGSKIISVTGNLVNTAMAGAVTLKFTYIAEDGEFKTIEAVVVVTPAS